MRVAIIRVSNELLHHLLKLPGDAKVIDFSRDLYFDRGEYALKVESATFPEVIDGHAAPQLSPIYQRFGDGAGEFVGWGDKPQ